MPRTGVDPLTPPPASMERRRPRGLQFLNVLERETSGENDVPHLSSNVRKIVPETRAQSSLVSGIAILLTLLLRGEIVIPFLGGCQSVSAEISCFGQYFHESQRENGRIQLIIYTISTFFQQKHNFGRNNSIVGGILLFAK